MKNKIKKWLGITTLEKIVGKEKEEKKEFWSFSRLFWSEYPIDNSLITRHQRLRDDFEELDKKFDALERYLQVEYYKEDKETQVYDWADKNHSEGFRKTPKTYEQMKKAKETKDEDDD